MAAKRSGSAGDVWLRPAARAAREAPPLSRDRIVAEAIALLDEEGADRLTMRRLAERLGTGSTTLYWHVKTKDDVLDLALDAIFAAVEIPGEVDTEGSASASASASASGGGGGGGGGADRGAGGGGGRAGGGAARDWRAGRDWRADITALITGWHAVLLAHPWSAALLGRPMLGPNVLARSEFLYATLVAAGVTEPHLTAAAYGLSNYVIGSALMQATWTVREHGAQQAAREHFRASSDRYPVLAAHGPLAEDGDWDGSFTIGLTWLLDGIQTAAVSAADRAATEL
ncbi:TetR/AcrR family transcriptional regulator C-terminal domain-containing protein [Nonomuraea maheshkhaliensis]|uniref:TetR/AcrR family transcriptional regulator C-terminal domain-containing protein n=1 Tax=Nonomuraea maheshkhaliensis TaxID=419590 RepID=A0ABN2FFW5_9ACTN